MIEECIISKRSNGIETSLEIEFRSYSSPIFRISKRPQPVPTSSSFKSAVSLTIVAPVAREIRLLSDFFVRRTAEIPAAAK